MSALTHLVQGNACYFTTFMGLAALAVGGACIASFLATILADFYKEVILARTAEEPGGYFSALGLHSTKATSAEAL